MEITVSRKNIYASAAVLFFAAAVFQLVVIQQKSDRISSLEQDNTDLNRQNQNLQSTIENLRSNISSQQRRITNLHSDLSDIRDEKNSLSTQLTAEENEPLVYASIGTAVGTRTQDKTFHVSVFNFGKTEATDVSVFCGIREKGDIGNWQDGFVGDAGNIASDSSKTATFDYTTEKRFTDAVTLCMAVSCDDCELLGPDNGNFQSLYDYYRNNFTSSEPVQTT